MAEKIKTEFLHSRREIKKDFLHSRREIKDSKKVEHFHFHLAKKWHDKWSKNVMRLFGIFLWVLVLGSIFGVGYLIHWVFNLLVSR